MRKGNSQEKHLIDIYIDKYYLKTQTYISKSQRAAKGECLHTSQCYSNDFGGFVLSSQDLKNHAISEKYLLDSEHVCNSDYPH